MQTPGGGQARQIAHLGQWQQYKDPLPHARVRDTEFGLVDHPVAIDQKIEIERARAVGHEPQATVPGLDPMEPRQQNMRLEFGSQLGRGVEIGRLAGGAVDRLGFVQPGARQNPNIAIMLEFAQGALEMPFAVAEVGPQRNKYTALVYHFNARMR